MSWAVGYDERWKRDIGYGVPAFCDHPRCNEEIDRGLGHVCGGDVRGGEHGCGLYFCGKHLRYYTSNRSQCCSRCGHYQRLAFAPKPDHPDWIRHKLTDATWAEWRAENPEEVAELRSAAGGARA